MEKMGRCGNSIQQGMLLKMERPSQYQKEDVCQSQITVKNNILRGFILLHSIVNDHATHEFLLWNPVTGSHKTIRYYADDPNAPCWRGFHRKNYSWSSLGYDETSDDYLLVIGWWDVSPLGSWWGYFSVRTNSWKEIQCDHCPAMYVVSHIGLFFNGAIHWLAVKDTGICPMDMVIVVFDLAAKHVSMIPLPMVTLLDMQGGSEWKLKLLGGCLGICYSMDDCKTEIWVMKQYKFGVGQSQQESEVVESVSINCRNSNMEMVMFTESLLSLPHEFGDTGEEQGK
ncbi:hypothetical protein PIB30_040737 [Stylosanthes scabra]|uniref:F-box associated beta-propeller type 1 domain-containing protein n=1 Tax=Stylosanthes scabra TaxID=79078 RepID=A0ABU6VG66_9FABA|nr:hypothetical protein [Stylosanthes scabra]